MTDIRFGYDKPRWIVYNLKRKYNLNRSDVDILSYIYFMCNKNNSPVTECAQTIADETGNCPNTVRTAIKRLLQKELIFNKMSVDRGKRYSITVNHDLVNKSVG